MTDPATLAKRIEPYHAVMFGLESGCAHTSDMKRAWAGHVGKEIAYVACDRSEVEENICSRLGLQRTPTLSFGGVQFPGFVPLPKVKDLLDLADSVGEGLKARKSTLFTRDGCGWCDRQQLMLGPLAPSVEVVNCSESAQASRCKAAGVAAVPAWRMGDDKSGSPIIPGFRVLPELRAMVLADSDGLKRMASAASGGDGKTC